MKYKYISIFFSAVALLLSCSKEENAEPVTGSAITMEATIGAPTKVAYDGDKASFAAGDMVSLYAWMGSATEIPAKKIVDGVVNTLDGESGLWKPATQMLWSPVKENHYFLGVYPAKSITNFTADAYALGADLMIATELDGIPFQENAEPVALTFTHAMARLDVNLRFRNQWENVPAVTSVATTSKSSYTVNYLTKAVTATGNAVQVPLQALATAVSGHHKSYSSLQVPQDGVTTVTIIIDSKSYIFTAAEPIALESGKVTTLNLHVGLDKIELGSVTVAPWIEKNPIAGGEALIPATGISFKEGTSASVEIGNTYQLTPVFAPEGATDVNCTWKSLNTSVATVDEMGLITAKARGEAVIECTCSGKTAQFTLTVKGLAPVYTAPTAKIGLVYNNTNLALLNAGSVTSEGPVMQYSLDQTSWSTTIPTGKNAGNYDVYWRLQAGGNYEGVASTKIVATIAKKAPNFSLSSSTASFSDTDNVDATKTVTITYDGDGTLSASSNNTSKVTASVSNKTITLTRKSVDDGTVTITVSAAAGTNYSAPANKQITVSLTANITGKALKDASVGWKYGSDGKAYPANASLPTGVTVQGMVAYKNGNSGIVMRSTYHSEELSNWRADMAGSDPFGSTNAYTSSLDNTTSCDWRTGTMAEYKNCGLTSVSGFNTLNTRLQTAGCNKLENNRYLGAKNYKRFYSGDGEWEDWNLSGTCLIRPIFVF